MNLFFLPCESIEIAILVILEATGSNVSLKEKKVSVLHTGVPKYGPGDVPSTPCFQLLLPRSLTVKT